MHVTSAYNVLLFLAPTKTGNTGTYEPIYTVNNLYNDFIILQDVFLTWKLCFWYIFTWNLVLFTSNYIDISSPIGASLYNIGTRIRSQRTTSSSCKCTKELRCRRLFINNGCEEKQQNKQEEIRFKFNRHFIGEATFA